MNVKKAAEYFELGVVAGFRAVRDPMGTGWLLEVLGKGGDRWTLETALGKPRTFASLDTLVGQVELIAGQVSLLAVGITS